MYAMRRLLNVKVFCVALVFLSLQHSAGADCREESAEPSLLRRIFCRLSWEEVGNVVETPRQICVKVRQNVRYSEDFNDQWAGGRETWEKGAGDCEDIAACVVDLCKRKNMPAAIIVFCPDDSLEGHALALGKTDRGYWISSNGWYEEVKSLEEAKDEVARELGWKGRRIAVTTLDKVNRETSVSAPTLRSLLPDPK